MVQAELPCPYRVRLDEPRFGQESKLNDEDMAAMQTLAADLLSMERGQSKAETGKEHLERNDFIIEKQKEEMNRLNATRLYREHQLEVANQKMREAESVTNALIEQAQQKNNKAQTLTGLSARNAPNSTRKKGASF